MTELAPSRVVLARVGECLLAVPAHHIREVFERGLPTRLPLRSPYLLGLLPVHGRVLPLVSLAGLVQEPEPGASLTLLLELTSGAIACPVEEVLGFGEAPVPTGASATPDLLTEVTLSTGRQAALLSVAALERAVQAHLLAQV